MALSILLLVGCSSAKKEADSTKDKMKSEAAAVQAKAEGTVDKIKKEVGEQTKTGDEIVSSLSCTNSDKKDTRTLEVAKVGDGCRVYYTKFGVKKSAATSRHGVKHCETVKENIQKNLIAAQFQCK